MRTNLLESEIAQRAIEFENQLLTPSGSSDDRFEAEQSGLASTLRLLNAVFTLGRSGSEQAHQKTDLPCEYVGRFRLIERLGSGAHGEVFRAYDERLEREVAIKIAKNTAGQDGEARDRLMRERVLACRLRHPNIVAVHESDEVDDQLFVVSELCRGPSMADWLSELREPVSPRIALEMVRQLASALQHSHDNGVLHRDIKPANILMEINDASSGCPWTPRLTDFGLARDFAAAGDRRNSGVFLGTLMYASPEQLKGEVDRVSQRSDIYSLGLVLFELLTGTSPFHEFPQSRMGSGSDSEVTKPSRYNVEVPAALDRICGRCLAAIPEDRFQSADELEREIGVALNEADANAAESSAKTVGAKHDRAWLSVLAAASVLLLGGLTLNSFVADTSAPQPSDTQTGLVQLNGIDDHLMVESFSYNGSFPITAEVWIKASEQQKATVLSLSGILSLQLQHLVPVAVACPAEEVYLNQYASEPIKAGEWVHLAVAHDGNRVSLFVNGTKSNGPTSILRWDESISDYVSENTALPELPLSTLFPTLGLVVGSQYPSGDRPLPFPFHGAIDELKVSQGVPAGSAIVAPRRLESNEKTLAIYHFDLDSKGQRAFRTHKSSPGLPADVVRE
ncbi:MAG: protein kinase [Rubripirellula sp.]